MTPDQINAACSAAVQASIAARRLGSPLANALDDAADLLSICAEFSDAVREHGLTYQNNRRLVAELLEIDPDNEEQVEHYRGRS